MENDRNTSNSLCDRVLCQNCYPVTKAIVVKTNCDTFISQSKAPEQCTPDPDLLSSQASHPASGLVSVPTFQRHRPWLVCNARGIGYSDDCALHALCGIDADVVGRTSDSLYE